MPSAGIPETVRTSYDSDGNPASLRYAGNLLNHKFPVKDGTGFAEKMPPPLRGCREVTAIYGAPCLYVH